jgi:ABC-type bacteriocin/lantibiotic exporter with double-glycine peptidase domain
MNFQLFKLKIVKNGPLLIIVVVIVVVFVIITIILLSILTRKIIYNTKRDTYL